MSSNNNNNKNRRMTLGGDPSHHHRKTASTSNHNNNNNRRDSLIPPSPGKTSGSNNNNNNNNKIKIPKSRKSMIPRMGRENVLPTSSQPNGEDDTTSSSYVMTYTGTTNRRTSIDPGNNNNNNNDRRTSMLFPNLAAGGASSNSSSSSNNRQEYKDPRPVNDKNYQQKCIRALLDFLLKEGYQYPISLKSLLRPSAKDFSNIVTFMIRLYDSNFQNGSNIKFEDEVAFYFKLLGYPLTLSKTAIVAAGSTNTWPSLLAALTWFMEQLKVNASYTKPNILHNPAPTEFETMKELCDKTEMAFYEYLGGTYEAFLKEDGAEIERLEEALSDRFVKDDAVLEQSVEHFLEIKASYKQQIKDYEAEAADLPIYTKKREDYATDLEQFYDLMRQMEDHKASLHKKIKEKTAELSKTNDLLDKKTHYIDDLKKTIATQELSVNDIHKIEAEMKGLRESLDRTASTNEQRNKTILAHEKELVKILLQADSIITSFNVLQAELDELSNMSNQLFQMKLLLDKEKLTLQHQRRGGGEEDELLEIDIQNDIENPLSQCQEEYMAENAQLKEQYNDELDKLEQNEEKYKASEAKLRIAKERVSKGEQLLQSEQDAMRETLLVRQQEVDAMEAKAKSVCDPIALEKQIAEWELHCSELERRALVERDADHAQKKAMVDEIVAACNAMKEFDEKFKQTLAEAKAYGQMKLEALQKKKIHCKISLE